ncbi:bifunctional folylpolyglutamate synthase/dihydrofolate synthase [Eubacteriales bacterium OttesenSCG-928-M02]|nr:bifunctional folylpolyglutamate synthase/dihydrofolate synthase [Eubacteriales bacterium OttesenSCG-928-M02]
MSHRIWELWTEAQKVRMGDMLSLMGREDLFDDFPIIQVAGTNGKGSVCAYLAKVLEEAGYKVGLFTSPHLYRETERIRINGEEIDLKYLTRKLDAIYEEVPETRLFSAYLAVAMEYFDKERVDIAVVETGLGGAMDVTSALLPILCCTCTIGLDHMEVLGETLEEIAVQKAGIAKPGIPMVLYPVIGEAARAAFTAECQRLGAPVLPLEEADFSIEEHRGKIRLDYHRDGLMLDGIQIPLLGRHQAYNAATAIRCAEALREMGYTIADDAIRRGIEGTVHQGRLEVIGEEPLVLVDGAHNVEGAMALRDAVQSIAFGRPVYLLTAMMADKDVDGVAKILWPMAEKVVATLAKEERGMDPEKLAAHYGEKAVAVTDPKAAYERIREMTPTDGVIVIAGSLYLPERIGLNEMEKGRTEEWN